MFPSLSPIYAFQLNVVLTEVNKGVSETKVLHMNNVSKFAILGGAKRTITVGGDKGIGDADVMSEFYQAKQFHNLILTKELDFDTFTLYRIYDKKLTFQFSFLVKSLTAESRFRILELSANKARILKPPSTEDEGETLNIQYSNPQVLYWYGTGKDVKAEKL
jgi:hypothetical protein